jgi:hypothetical protein
MTVCVAVLLLLSPLTASAQLVAPPAAGDGKDGTPDRRHHYILRDADAVIHFEVTTISRSSEQATHETVLVRDPTHGDAILQHIATFSDMEVSFSISDVKKRDYIRSSFKLPFNARTRSGMLEESARQPQLQRTPALLTITTNGGEWRGVDSEWGQWQKLRTLRHSIRPTLSFYLLEIVERMRGSVFATHPADTFYDFVGKYVVYDVGDELRLPDLKETVEQPDCSFDKAFGYPCTDEQAQKVRAAEAAGQVLANY